MYREQGDQRWGVECVGCEHKEWMGLRKRVEGRQSDRSGLQQIVAVMFKKPVRAEVKTNIKNVKAAFNKCISHRDISNKLHSRSTIDYPESKLQRTLPIFDNLIDQIQHSHSQLLFSTKGPLKSIPKDSLNQSYSKSKLNLDREMNLPNLKKSTNKKGFNETNKRVVTQPQDTKPSPIRNRVSDNKQNTQLSQENRKLRIINKHLEEQNEALMESLKKYQLRERSLLSQLKESQNSSEHAIIIQSLKRVIDSQLEKIIQLEREVIMYSQKQEREKDPFRFKDKCSVEDYTPNFAPSSPKRVIFDQSNNSTQQDMNMYIQYVDTFRRDKGKENYAPSILETKQKQLTSHLTINPSTHSADELLSEIDDCLDSLSRRKRQLS